MKYTVRIANRRPDATPEPSGSPEGEEWDTTEDVLLFGPDGYSWEGEVEEGPDERRRAELAAIEGMDSYLAESADRDPVLVSILFGDGTRTTNGYLWSWTTPERAREVLGHPLPPEEGSG